MSAGLSRGLSENFLLGRAREKLLELALGGPSHENVLERAVELLAETLDAPWGFWEDPEEGDIEKRVPVFALGRRLGYLAPVEPGDFSLAEPGWRELGLAFGLCLLVADQGRAIAEMESASADFLRFAPDALFVLDEGGNVAMSNRRALELLERAEGEVIGRPLAAVLGSGTTPSRGDIRSSMESCVRLEMEVSGGSGRRLWSLGFSAIGDGQVLCLARDITKERLAHLAVHRAERGVMLGQAVEYLVHEVNNPLAALLSSTSMERRRMKEFVDKLEAAVESGSDLREVRADLLETASRLRCATQSAHDNAERIRATMATLRHAHRQLGEISADWVDLGYEVGLGIGIVEQEMGSVEFPRVEVFRELTPMPRVLAPPLVLAEIVASLLRNAVHFSALARGEAAKTWVRTCLKEKMPIVEVEDNGPGIPVALAQRVFMPFFSTRADEGALGLGLAQARDAAQRLGGELVVLTGAQEGGACLRLTLTAHRERC